jgi:hypothetical protein
MTAAEEIGIRWPSGEVTRLKNEVANQILVIDEEKGILRRQSFSKR